MNILLLYQYPHSVCGLAWILELMQRNHRSPFLGTGPPDDRYIRAETCMFMIKLPQYSSQEVMTERLRYAIHCREDPLSG